MSDSAATPNTIGPGVRDRSTAEGDVPDHLRRRYYTDGRGGAGLGFYTDARIATPAFRDRGRRLVTARSDPNAIRDMVAIAEHRRWAIIVARGDESFRRQVWLAGRGVGLEVRGYRATERDLQELERKMDRAASRRRAFDKPDAAEQVLGGVEAAPGPRSRLQVVEAVVRARVKDPSAQDRIVSAARSRVADWLERGARFEPIRTGRSQNAAADRPPGRERNYGR